MGNTSYCRFQNTASDFSDCVDHIADEDLSDEENSARDWLINDAIRMLYQLGYDVELRGDAPARRPS